MVVEEEYRFVLPPFRSLLRKFNMNSFLSPFIVLVLVPYPSKGTRGIQIYMA